MTAPFRETDPKDAAIANPAEGYNQVAPFYDSWRWSRFWDANETPIVCGWLDKIPFGRVLDAGCGTGRYREAIQSRGLAYVGIDVSDQMLAISERKARASQYGADSEFCRADVRDIPLPADSLTSVLCARALSHVAHPADAFREFRRVLAVGGLAIVTDIHARHPYEQTAIDTPDGVVKIETYKHTPESLRGQIETLGGFDVASFQEYRLADLTCKPGPDFAKLYKTPQSPIFYCLVLRKR